MSFLRSQLSVHCCFFEVTCPFFPAIRRQSLLDHNCFTKMYLGMDPFLSNPLRFVRLLESVSWNVQFEICSTVVQYLFCPIFSPFFFGIAHFTLTLDLLILLFASLILASVFLIFFFVFLFKLFLLIYIALIITSKLVLNPTDSLILSIVFLISRISVF